MGSRLVSLLLYLVFVSVVGCGGGGKTNTPAPTMTGTAFSTSFSPDHVFLIVLENHSFSQVIGSPAMPSLNSLAAQHGLSSGYFANTHPSIGNYFMVTAGAMETNNDAFAGIVSDNNIVRALNGAGKTWKAYMESIPAVGYTGGDVYPYSKHHNPFVFFSDVLSSSVQVMSIVPFTQLASDVSAGASFPATRRSEHHVVSVDPATTGHDDRSAVNNVEHRPADLVAQPLIVQDEVANRVRELFALPTALEPSRAVSLTYGRRRARSLDRVGTGMALREIDHGQSEQRRSLAAADQMQARRKPRSTVSAPGKLLL